MTASGVFRLGMLCFIGGTATGLFFSWSLGIALMVCALSIVLLVSWFPENRLRMGRNISLCLVAFLGAWLWSAKALEDWNALPEIDTRLERAIVVRQVEQKENSKQATLQPIECGGVLCPDVLVQGVFPLFADIAEGDILSLSCRMEKPERFTKEFDYPKMLAKDGIGYVCRFPKTWNKEGVSEGKFSASMRAMRRAVERGIGMALPEPEAGFVAGILVGGDDRLSKDIQEKFSRTGLSHIVAVSGYNVSIVAVLLMSVLILCGWYRQQALWGALLGIGIFTILVGAPSSAVRAAIMAGIALGAARLGRLGNSVNAILLAGIIMLLLNPLLLRYDIGFQLSFAATLGIILLSPFALLSLRWGDVLSTTIVAEIFVLPLILFYFHTAPILALPTNMLIVPFVPITMFLGSVAALLSIVVPSLAPVFGFPAFLFSRTILETVDFFSRQTFAVVETPSFGIGSLFLYYAALFCGIVIFRKKIFSHKAPFPPSILLYGGSCEPEQVLCVATKESSSTHSKSLRV